MTGSNLASHPLLDLAVVHDHDTAMRAVDVIRKKRDGEALSASEIAAFVEAATSGHWPDYQLSALLMAIFCRGMDSEETTHLTSCMTRSGHILRHDEIAGPKGDKHSTGGVSDSTSLVLVPVAAECGVIVPMMSGRALGHTGGTLDKLDAIPGLRTQLTVPEMKSALRQVGAVMIGQTAEVAPADRKLYSLRDVTATVECIPLIAASIMSKKLAEGIESLVLDVKFGGGAFIKDLPRSRQLAEAMVAIGKAHGVRTQAVLTAMDAPLGNAIGNSLEVIECLEVLRGQGPRDLTELSLDLAARLVFLAGVTRTLSEAHQRVQQVWQSGAALERWRRIVEQQGGDPHYLDDPSRLPRAPVRRPVKAEREGYVTSIFAEPLGVAAMRLGAGRQRAEDTVDHGVGIRLAVRVGEEVKIGDRLAEIWARSEQDACEAAHVVLRSCRIDESPAISMPVIRDTID